MLSKRGKDKRTTPPKGQYPGGIQGMVSFLSKGQKVKMPKLQKGQTTKMTDGQVHGEIWGGDLVLYLTSRIRGVGGLIFWKMLARSEPS